MARRRKLEKFAELLKFPHVFEMTEPGSGKVRQSIDSIISVKGKWKKKVFQNENPLCLELACGRGEYTVGLARLYPHKNFVGIDIKGARIYKGAKISETEGLKNVAFLRIRIEQLELYFEKGEVDEIWITFPDPFPAKENRRLTAPIFLNKYSKLLKPSAHIHLKTDDNDLFIYSVQSAESHSEYSIKMKSENISKIRLNKPELNITTYYEESHLKEKRTIKYLFFVKND